MRALSRLVFGLVVPAVGSGTAQHVERLTWLLGQRLGIPVEARDAASYAMLGDDVRAGRIDLAWLPPIVFLDLGAIVRPLGCILRRGSAPYASALVVPEHSTFTSVAQLHGARAGWVERTSASGYVLPRVGLLAQGIDPARTFATETFHGSHRSLMQALRAGHCDVAGTYARADGTGRLTAGAWSELSDVRVRILASFGEVPPDVIAMRSVLAESASHGVFAALRDIGRLEPGLVEGIFGGEEIKEGLAPGYADLRDAVASLS